MAEPGRPAYTDEQYKIWLEAMRPFLTLGCSLWRGIERAGLEQNASTIYEKYRLNDWFSQKVDKWRSTPGENINEALVTLTNDITDKVKRKELLTHDESDILKHMSEKHRTAQPFFVTRTETIVADASKVGKILDAMEIDNVSEEATKLLNGTDTAKQPTNNI
jgi:hypothetical protein